MRPKKTLALALALFVVFALAWTTACRDDKSDESGGGGFLGDLAKPQDGRSMRATSAMRVGELRRGPDGDRNTGPRKYDPKADLRGDTDIKSNWDNFNVPPGGTHVLLDETGPGRHHPHLDHLPRPRAAGLGPQGLGQPSGDAAPDLLGRQRAPGRRGARWATSSPTASASAARSSACRSSSRAAIPTTASGGCRSASRPGSRSRTRATSR